MNTIIGTTSRGLIAPIINSGDDIVEIAVNTLLKASKSEGFSIEDKDILSLTESVVARAQGNYATFAQVASDVNSKISSDTVGLVFPILSRNRFAPCLEGIASTGKKIVLLLSYPADEVGNHLIDPDVFEDLNVNPWADVFSMAEFRKKFGTHTHKFTGVDYLEFYDGILKKYNKDSFIILSNNAKDVLKYTDSAIACDIHTRAKTKKQLQKYNAKTVLGLDDLLTASVNGSGYNSKYGLLGSNKASDTSLKLFPEHCTEVVQNIQKKVYEKTGKTIEVMIYGDGAFKDPVGKIWELADPVVSPAYTSGLEGTPNEVKLKYLADNMFNNLPPEEQQKQLAKYIDEHQKNTANSKNAMVTEGTTPRRITDLLGSLSDLTSGSGDKGTPFIFIKGYFKKYKG